VSAKPPAKSLKPGGAPARRGSSRTTGTREARGARGAAYDLLHSVAADNAYANLAMPGILETPFWPSASTGQSIGLILGYSMSCGWEFISS
jgi:hypothetical protein